MSEGFKKLAKIASPSKKLGGLKSALKVPTVKGPTVVKSYVRNG